MRLLKILSFSIFVVLFCSCAVHHHHPEREVIRTEVKKKAKEPNYTENRFWYARIEDPNDIMIKTFNGARRSCRDFVRKHPDITMNYCLDVQYDCWTGWGYLNSKMREEFGEKAQNTINSFVFKQWPDVAKAWENDYYNWCYIREKWAEAWDLYLELVEEQLEKEKRKRHSF